MHKFWKQLEHYVDRAIPYCLVALIPIIVGELFYHDALYPYHTYILIIDAIIVGIFIIDLIFKYIRTKNIYKFVRYYWLEILAVLPFFMIIRIIEEFAALASYGQTAQATVHEVVSISKEGELLTKEAERLSRSRYFSKIFKPLARIPRLLRAAKFFEKPR